MTTPTRGQLKHDPVAEAIMAGLRTAKQQWQRYAPFVIAALVIGGIAWYVISNQRSLPMTASTALAKAQSPEALAAVATKYPTTFAAPAALAQLGALAVQSTNYSAAFDYYQQLAQRYPQNFLAPAALLAMVKCRIEQACQEAAPARKRELYEEAEQILRRDLLYNRDHYAVAFAQLELVRILYAQGRMDAAWQELEQWDREVGQSYLASLADGLRETLLRVTGVSTNMLAQQMQGTDEPMLQ